MKNRILFFLALFFFSPLPAPLYAQTPESRRLSAPAAMLDDYEIAAPGTLTLGWSAFYNRVLLGDDRTLPAGDLSLGLTHWLDVSASVTLARSRFERFKTTARGDSYVSAKLRLLPEGRRRPAVAFQSSLEVLGRPSLANNVAAPDKFNGVFGAIVGKDLSVVRIYTHTGYFTRGVFFSSAALDVTMFSRVTPTAYVTFGVLTDHRDVAASILNNVSRPDVGGTIGFRFSKNWTGYVTGSRSLGRRDPNSSDYHLGGGLSYTIKLWGTR